MTENNYDIPNPIKVAVLKELMLQMYGYIRGTGHDDVVEDVGEYEAPLVIKGYELAILSVLSATKALVAAQQPEAELPDDPLRRALAGFFEDESA